MSFTDFLAKFAPGLAYRMADNRLKYEITQNAAKNAARLYDAASGSQYRKPILGAGQSPDAIMSQAGTRLRDLARHLEENHDLTNAVFDDVINNVVGDGVSKAPLVRDKNGKLARDFNAMLSELFDEWAENPDTSGQFGFETMERQILRHVLRDGEIFLRPVIGSSRFNYQGKIPLAFDLMPAEYCPMDYEVLANGVFQGIQLNQWGAPVQYYFYKEHPADFLNLSSVISSQVKGVRAVNVMHLKHTKRLKQRRGVTLIHAVIQRLQDIKDYEESERIAAKVAADFTFAITKQGQAAGPTAINSAGNRTFGMSAGMGFELQPGESVETINSNRPNTGLNDFRMSMLRAVAGGTGTRASSISRDYNGTYSAQRQELVEGSIAYRAHFIYLLRNFYKPMWREFVRAAVLSRQIPVKDLRSVDASTLERCEFRPPALPWIDPAKEAKAWETLIKNQLESRSEVMRTRNRDPQKVIDEMQAENENELFSTGVEAVVDDAATLLNDDEQDDTTDTETEDNENEQNAA